MSYQTNTYEVGTVLNVFGQAYSLLAPFDAYPELTIDAYRSLPEPERLERVDAFYARLSAELGIDLRSMVQPGSEDRRLNPLGCPVDDFYTITAVASHGTAGTKEGKALYRSGETVSMATEPDDPDRAFDGWYSSDVLVYAQRQWSFPATMDLALEARYKGDATVTVESANPELGLVSGGGTFPIGKTVTVRALVLVPNRFDGWYSNGELVSSSPNYSFILEEDITLTARFSAGPSLQYDVLLLVDNPAKGSVSGGGLVTPGDSVTCVADPNGGMFYGWWNEANQQVSGSLTYVFVPTGSITLTAKFDAPT